MSEMSGADHAVVEALRDAAEFIRTTSGIGVRAEVNDFSNGWYAALDYAISELLLRADRLDPQPPTNELTTDAQTRETERKSA